MPPKELIENSVSVQTGPNGVQGEINGQLIHYIGVTVQSVGRNEVRYH